MTTRNGDAHLKNFGVVYARADAVELAPAYDLVTTTVYLPKDQPALSLAGRKVWPDRPTLERFGLNACNLRKKDVRRAFERVSDGVSDTRRAVLRFSRRRSEH